MCVDPYLNYRHLPKFPLDHYRAKRDGIFDFLRKHGINPEKTKHLSHKRVENYISQLYNRGIITTDFFLSFMQSKDLRFNVNYAPAYFGDLEIDKEMASLIQIMQDNLNEANTIIFMLNEEYVRTSQRHKLPWHPHDLIESFIGDAIGDDFTQNYLNHQESKEVFEILTNALLDRNSTQSN